MSSSFAFIPRKVAKPKKTESKVKDPLGAQGSASSSQQPTSATSSKGKEKATTVGDGLPGSNDGAPQRVGKGVDDDREGRKAKAAPSKPLVDEGDAVLVWLALSDYALWSDGELRRRLTRTAGTAEDVVDTDVSMFNPTGNDGYISLKFLLNHSPILSPLKKLVGTSQTPLIKLLRSQTPNLFDVQLIVSEPQPWFNRHGYAASSSSSSGPSGYEIRRKEWSDLGYTKNDWEERTIYIEHVPIEHRTVPSLVKFILSLLPEGHSKKDASSPLLNSLQRVQHVHLPPHHQAKPSEIPSFKGFALITFLHLDDAQHFLRAYPWMPDESAPSSNPEVSSELSKEGAEASQKALQYGFRTLSKKKWDALRQEYQAYRQTLVSEISAFQTKPKPTSVAPTRTDAVRPPPDSKPQPTAPVTKTQEAVPPPATDESNSSITNSSPYPYGCLVFIKNIHTETNKTTLKTLFGRALVPAGVNPTSPESGLDYVDFNKGMDTCHLRLSTPQQAEKLASHFNNSPIIQTSGLDDQGSPSSESTSKNPDLKPIAIEIVRGKREEMYWQKVPEKIRRGAVEKSLRLLSGAGEGDVVGGEEAGDCESTRPKKKRRKR
ncbi:hypothetical protein CC1G_09945 [Coprinopsis cinerea okayama7|uniref:XRRM domain-containing protein n=1 Tax=Coprinopsis cinerea (strain Okayama-7 / 130 / ATCC MYA-4618 / FGSC 9003) TaxID=240176 RepID=A8PGQ1_COPC7|nr:hypothetical protein CC1G_09945 [Coprinopsis cinerea okayama7\|eukprot:XP_001841253.1 hypothetical protein CC1G_09945 [Coprinopsis cinerea okayama7\